MRLGILTGGGDVPGLNPCIQAIALLAAERGWSVLGFRQGWLGPLTLAAGAAAADDWTVPLAPERVRGIDQTGGTILHTSRIDPRRWQDRDWTADVRSVLDQLGIDVLITLGGDGTLRFSAHLSQLGMPVISIPKTMDNDVFGTDYCIGFSTAITRSVDAINALRTTAASHERIAVVELFGRRSGETALLAGFLSRADRIAIAETPVDAAAIAALLCADRAANPDRYAVCVISEGARLSGDTGSDDLSLAATRRQAEGPGVRLARQIELQGGVGTIVQELAYLMRSGAPDALDRMVAFAFGALAVQLVEGGETGRMVALRDGNYTHVPVDAPLGGTRRVDVTALYDSTSYRARLTRVSGMPMFLY